MRGDEKKGVKGEGQGRERGGKSKRCISVR